MKPSFIYLTKNTVNFITVTANRLILVGILCLSFDIMSNDKLPLPSFPANFEVAEYEGSKGCIPDDPTYMTAVAENAGTKWIGIQQATQSLKNGKYHAIIQYNAKKDIGYILADRHKGNMCLIEMFSNFSYMQTGKFEQVAYRGLITKNMCSLIPYSFKGICGNFTLLSSKLIKNGFELQWQAKNIEGNIITLLSGKNKSYVLTTDRNSNATVITESSTASEFKWLNTTTLTLHKTTN
jgi:hypothetical protein